MKIQVIVGSNRPGRVSDRVAKWAAEELKTHQDVDVEIVDLQDYDLPMFNEAISPQYNPDRKPEGEVKRWLDKLAEADGYALALPEYNRAVPGPLSNAFAFLDFQMQNKPIGLVGHGSTGGAQAIANMRAMAGGMLAVTVPTATFLAARAGEVLDDIGSLDEEIASKPFGPHTNLKSTMDSLVWYTAALKAARQ